MCSKNTKILSKSFRISIIYFMVVVLYNISCVDWPSYIPKPTDYEYHTHPMYIYYQIIDTLNNQENDTVIQADFNLTQYRFIRPLFDVLYFNTYFPRNIEIKLVKGDTTTKICTTQINHYTGFQKEFNGDTTRFAQLDSIAEWEAYILASNGTVLLSNDRSVSLKSDFTRRIPDHVWSDFRIKMEFFWQGLFSGDTNLIYLHSENIRIFQF